MIITKNAIFAADDLKREIVPVPEWGTDAELIVSEMSALDRLEFSKSLGAEENKDTVYYALSLIWFVINADGSRMFTPDDVTALSKKSLSVLKRIYDVGERLNLLHATPDEEIKN